MDGEATGAQDSGFQSCRRPVCGGHWPTMHRLDSELPSLHPLPPVITNRSHDNTAPRRRVWNSKLACGTVADLSVFLVSLLPYFPSVSSADKRPTVAAKRKGSGVSGDRAQSNAAWSLARSSSAARLRLRDLVRRTLSSRRARARDEECNASRGFDCWTPPLTPLAGLKSTPCGARPTSTVCQLTCLGSQRQLP